MSMNKKNSDKLLGLDQNISRRDFLNASLLGAGGALLYSAAPQSVYAASQTYSSGEVNSDWYGYGGVGDYASSHGNTPEVVNTAHHLRDGGFRVAADSIPVSEEYDLVIVGGGVAGLGAAWHFKKNSKPGQRCLILDNHPIFGGVAKENEFDVDGTTLIAPQGANGFFIPPKVADPEEARGDARYYAEFNIPRDLPFEPWRDTDKPLGFGKDNYGFLHWLLQDRISMGHFYQEGGTGKGVWCKDVWKHRLANTPLSEEKRKDMLQWRDSRWKNGLVDEKTKAWLDSMTYQQFLEKELKLGPEGIKYASPFLASAFGVGADVLSAYAAYNISMPGLLTEEQFNKSLPDRNSFPGGNSGFARYFLKNIMPEAIEGSTDFNDVITGRINASTLDKSENPIRIRTDSTIFNVQHQGSPESADSVKILYTKNGKIHALKSKAVVMASGGWINRYVVRDMPVHIAKAYGQFDHAPFLVANVALRNWRFLYKLGITGCRWEGGFGYSCNIRQPMHVGRHTPALDPDKPIVLTFYVPFSKPGMPARAQVVSGRTELLTTSYASYERQIREQMARMFAGAGFDPKRDIAGITLNRWGHPYVVTGPGFFIDTPQRKAPRNIVREGYGRIGFAHAELYGFQHWGPAADEGRRAVEQLLEFL